MSKSSAPGSRASLHRPGGTKPRGRFSPRRTGNDLLFHISPVVTAVLVDSAFFLRRSRRLFGDLSPEEAARKLHSMALDHLNDDSGRRVARLYRIFVYDAAPPAWKGHLPIARTPVDLRKTDRARWRLAFHDALRGMRKVALRLGEVPATTISWRLREGTLRELLKGRRAWAEITDSDFFLDMRQKGVDMRLGLDIASLAYKRQVNQIVLVTGDSDFVPAAKLARREGVDVILDPMWATIRPELFEHVDGIRSVCPRPRKSPRKPA